jgi:uncharacterized protein (TIGR00730 family)
MTVDMSLDSVTVFASSSTKVDRVYFDSAAELGRALAAEGWTLIYGGNRVGPMGALADAVRSGGGKVVGVTPKVFLDHGHGDDLCTELVVVDSMRRRKELMESRGDAFVTLPGGLGTLEEFFEIVVGQFLGFHGKPVVLLNIAGFFNDLLHLIERQIRDGFVRPAAWEQVHVAATVPDAVAYLRRWEPRPARSRL